MRPYIRLMQIFLVTAILGMFMDYRFHRAGEWLPPIPTEMGAWSSRDTPFPEAWVKLLGNPKYMSRTYASPFGERVEATAVAAGSLDAYHEPTICAAGSGWSQTGERLVPVSGPGTEVRAMVLRYHDQRVIMYYWLQNRNGGLETDGGFYAYHDVMARLSSFRTIYDAVIDGHQTCIVRVYAIVPPDDHLGAQTRRNVAEIARGIHDALQKGS